MCWSMSKAAAKARQWRNVKQVVCAVCGMAGNRPLVNRGDSRVPRYEHQTSDICEMMRKSKRIQAYNPVVLRPR
jgi:hypothetical protein